MKLLYNITFTTPSTFCALNFFKGDLRLMLFSDKKNISDIRLLPVSVKRFHPSYPSFFISKTSSLLNGQPLDLVDMYIPIWAYDFLYFFCLLR